MCADMLSSAETIEAMKSTSDWVLANHNVVGYYRVNYDEANWERLLKTLNTTHKVRCGWQLTDGRGRSVW